MKINYNTKIKFLRLKKKDGQQFIKLIKNRFKNVQLINSYYKILNEKEYLLFPLVENQDLIDKLITFLEKNFNFKIISKETLPNLNYKYGSLLEVLKGRFPEKYLELIPQSYDIIGNITVIEFDKFNCIDEREFIIFKEKIAEAIIMINKNVKSVFEKKGKIKGTYRLRKLNLLYGENKSETIYKENNCNFKLDVKTTYFSPRLVFERRRIATSLIKNNEVIVDMFAGVGPFSIQIARNNLVKIYSFDVNPHAYQFLKENIKMNKLKGKIIPYNINVRDLSNSADKIGRLLQNKSDRIIMNLPEKSIEFVDIACFLMKQTGGILHFYQFSDKPNAVENTLECVNKKLNELNWEVEKILNSKIVKTFSPKTELVGVDLSIKYLNS